MKKLIHTHFRQPLLKLAAFFILELGVANFALAQLLNPIRAKDFGEVVKAIANAITIVGIPLAGIFLIYSGFLFVTSRGNEEQLKKAKTTFFWTIIGTVLIVGAWAIATALNEFAKGL